jgi:hypothetical protein
VVALVVARPLTTEAILEGALFAVGFPLGNATVGLVLTLRRPANPIGWLYAAPALTTRSTWTSSTASCWPWSTRPCNPPRPRCGSGSGRVRQVALGG